MSARDHKVIVKPLHVWVLAVCVGYALMSGVVSAQSEQSVKVDIEAQDLSSALTTFGRQTKTEIAFTPDMVGLKQAPAVKGKMTRVEVLDTLLADTSLEYHYMDNGTVIVRSVVASSSGDAKSGKSEPASSPVLMAQNQTSAAQTQTISTSETIGEEDEEDAEKLEEIIVTGTHIGAVSSQFSPVSTFTRDNFDAAGFGSVNDLIAVLPQNFGGGISPDQSGPTTNGAGSSAINLRGLGVEATLVLLNGRRIAPSGFRGIAVDVSGLPTSAIERVEVLTDGASAIYGADAVAGAVNIILRDDYNGAESRVRVGTITDGEGDEFQIGQTFGSAGERGRILVAAEYANMDALDSASKSFSQSAPAPTDLLPSTDRYNVFASGRLNVGNRWKLFSDAYLSDRNSDQTITSNSIDINVLYNTEVQQIGTSVGAGVELSENWGAEIVTSYSKNDFYNLQTSTPPLAFLEVTGETDIFSGDASLAGPLFEVGGGSVEAVFGTQYRDEGYDVLRQFKDSNQVVTRTSHEAFLGRDVIAAYAEFYVPVVGEANSRPGLDRLSFSLAGRYEDYSDVGPTFNPKAGIRWSPTPSVTVRGTYGTSFRAPRLEQLQDFVGQVRLLEYVDPEVPSGISIGIRVTGGTKDLNPEESTTWTVGLDFEPEFAPGLSVGLTYFDIEYDGRIDQGRPSLDRSTWRFFDHPLPVIRNVDPATVQAFVDAAASFFDGTVFSGSNSSLEDVTVILDSRPLNTVATTINGLDIAASYGINSNWNVSLSGSYMFNFDEQFSSVTPVVPLINRIGHPTDLRLRGGISWNSGRASAATIYVDYADDYEDDQLIGPPEKVSSWTTVDASYQYTFGSEVSPGLTLTLSVRNLFDRDPPSIGLADPSGLRVSSYDPVNADPEGRRVALQLTKRW